VGGGGWEDFSTSFFMVKRGGGEGDGCSYLDADVLVLRGGGCFRMGWIFCLGVDYVALG